MKMKRMQTITSAARKDSDLPERLRREMIMPVNVSYFSCLSKRSNQEKETEIVSHVIEPPTHKPKLSVTKGYRILEHFDEFHRKLNALGDAARARRRRFRGRKAWYWQKRYSEKCERNRLGDCSDKSDAA